MIRLETVLFACLLLAGGAFADGEELWGIPHKPDPPFAIDGDLSDWNEVPNAVRLDQAEQVVWGAGAWASAEDLSGTVRVAWRPGNLFVAVAVQDDMLAQTQRGAKLWKGDHIELFVDMTPELEPERDTLGEGQFQIGLSPGNFLNTGDPFTDCAAEAVCFQPNVGDVSGVVVASQQTASGWTLEASVPWRVLGVETVAQGRLLRLEVAISDTDTAEAQQQSMMTTRTDTWERKRSRYPLAALAGSDGVPPERVRSTPLLEGFQLVEEQAQEVTFTPEPVPEGQEAYLGFEARLDTEKVAGYTPALRVSVNGQVLGVERLYQRPLRVKARDGRVCSLAADDRMAVFYTPDFESPDADPRYGLLGGVKACTFVFRVGDLLREGENMARIERCAAATVERTLFVANGRLEFRPPPPPPREKMGPPKGPLPLIEPRPDFSTAYALRELPEGKIAVAFGGQTLEVESRFSSPTPAWVHGSCQAFQHERRIEQRPEAVVVHDMFTNLTDEPLGIMQRHDANFGGRLEGVWCGGMEQSAASARNAVSANPTTFGASKDAGLGFVALSDAFRIHVVNYAMDGAVGIADNSLVIGPKAAYTAEWAIVPCDAPDYWRFINAVRRLVGANFTIPGAFAFIHARGITAAWSDQQVIDFLRFKDAYYACTSIVEPRYKGHYTHGTSFQHVTHDNYREGIARWRALVPEAKYLVYFHCFIDPLDEAPERFADARILRSDGTQNDYGKPAMRLFCPTADNLYGQEVAKNVDIIFDTIGADGVYWDEHAYSRATYHYGEPWDGVSGDIDAKTMRVTRLKSSVALLSDAWKVSLAKRILARGPLVGNGSPLTRAMAALQFPCFHETGSISNCTRAHLYSPIALGDHLTERSEEDAYGTMLAALDYGCVYHWYAQEQVVPTHPHLTRYMYPITPMALHEGYILGRERIVTKKSGLYGWGGNEGHEVHVFDDTSKEVAGFEAPLREIAGKTYTELRIAEDWSAVIIRK